MSTMAYCGWKDSVNSTSTYTSSGLEPVNFLLVA
jgi:hypothetical protein